MDSSSSTMTEDALRRVQSVDLNTTVPRPRSNVIPMGGEQPTTLETAKSFYEAETLIGAGITSSMEWGRGDTDLKFNSYRYYDENKESLQDMDLFIRQGKFDDTANQGHFDKRVERFRRELKNRDNMENGTFTGNMLGMGLSLLDVWSLVPVLGQVKKGQSLKTALDYGWKSSAVAGGQEVVMHQLQEFRTMDESLFNVAAASVLMSAVGGYKGLTPTVRSGKASTSKHVTEEVDELGNPTTKATDEAQPHTDSVGSARVADTSESVMSGNRGVVGKAVEKLTSWIDQTTPVGRSFAWSIDTARDVTQRLMDTGGRLTKGHADGRVVENAESVKNAFKTEYDALLLRSENIVRDLNIAMSGTGPVAQQLKSDVTRGGKWVQSATGQQETFEMGLLETQDFNDYVVRTLHDYADGDYLAKLEAKWGPDNAKLIDDAAKQMSNEIGVANRHLEDLMVEHGLITEAQRMGDDYKMAQLWNSKAIGEDTYRARDFFLKVLQNEPVEEFIEDFGLTMDQYAKLGVEDVSIKVGDEEKLITKAEGVGVKREILEDWAGDTYEKALQEVEQAALQALEAEKTARKAMVEAAAVIRQNTTKIKNLSVKAAKEVVRKSHEFIELTKATRGKAKAEMAEAQAELKGKMHKEYAQQIAYVEAGPTARAVTAANQKLRKLLKVKGPLEQDPQAIKQAQEELVQAEISHTVAIDEAWRSVKVNTPEMAKYKEKSLEARRKLRAAENKIKAKQKRVAELEEAVGNTEAAIKHTRSLNKETRQAYKEMKHAWMKAARGTKKSARIQRRAGNAKNMVETVDELVGNLQHSQKSPQGVLHESMFEGGRSKSRKIHLTPEQTREAHDLGILNKDIHKVLDKQWDEVSARLALRQVFGKNVKLDLSDVKEEIARKYDDEIDYQRSRNKKSSHLKNEKRKVLADIDGLLERLYGRAGMPDDPDSALFWATGKAREYNFTRFGPEFIITSFTDAANMILTNGFGVYAGKYFKASSKIMKGMPDDVIHKIATSSERLLHQARHLKLAGSDNFNDGLGIGATGSAKQRITSNIDRLTAGLNEKVNVMSGLSAWNMKQKAMTMMFQQDKLVDIVNNPSILSDLERAKLATIGIGPDQLRLFKKMANEFGTSSDGGVKSFDAQHWQTRNEPAYREARQAFEDGKKLLKAGEIEGDDLDVLKAAMDVEYAKYAEGRDAYNSFVGSMRQAGDRGIMTPGIGDTPLLMDGHVAKLLMQFQTYGFVIMNKMLAPAAQRMHHYKDAEAVASIAMALALGGLVVMSKDMLRSGEIKERSASEWTRDIMDRSGMLAWISPYVSAFEKTTGLGSGSSRFQAVNVVGQVAGPSMGLAMDVSSGINALVDPERDDGADKLMKLAPYQALYKIADLTFDQ